jgi:hypothetical protein
MLQVGSNSDAGGAYMKKALIIIAAVVVGVPAALTLVGLLIDAYHSSGLHFDKQIAEGWLIIIGFVGIYFAPTTLASMRNNRQTLAIFMLNLLLGWTLLGWIAAVVWACIKGPPPRS